LHHKIYVNTVNKTKREDEKIMNINEKMMGLGAKSSVIRELFEYGKKRKAEIGDENVFDYSIGNPSVPAPAKVNETLVKIITETDTPKYKARFKVLEVIDELVG
jgi:aspartate aminotransferase